MKIKPEHLAHMREALRGAVYEPWGIARDKGLSPMRWRWDCLHAAKLTPWLCAVIYPYADDSHVDTALRAILGGPKS